MASRSQTKAEAAIKELKEQTGKDALFLKLDLGDLKTIKISAAEFLRRVSLRLPVLCIYLWNSKEPELHILFNNGGTCFPVLYFHQY
jgi:8-oxo-dGTP pyrophosphatase MutT (NUDIX family)